MKSFWASAFFVERGVNIFVAVLDMSSGIPDSANSGAFPLGCGLGGGRCGPLLAWREAPFQPYQIIMLMAWKNPLGLLGWAHCDSK